MDWLSVDLIKQSVAVLGTVVVAVLASLFATRRDTRQARIQRHFSFSDERSHQYAQFVRQVNDTWSAWYELARFLDGGDFAEEHKKAEVSALELDSQMNVLRLTAPMRIVDACAQVNGALQAMIVEMAPAEETSVNWRHYEEFKENMIAEMRADIDLINRSSDRLSYTKATAKLS